MPSQCAACATCHSGGGRATRKRPLGVPVDYDHGQQIQTGHAVMLAFGSTAPDFALSPNAQSAERFSSVMGFSLVEAHPRTALHIGIEKPFNDEQCSFNSSDFAKRESQFVLSWVRCKFLQQLTGL